MILVLMLVLAALTGLLATSNLDRTRQLALLDSASAMRTQSNEAVMQTLYQGIDYANRQLKREDFDIAQRGIYKTVDAQKMKSDYHRLARPVSASVVGADTGFWIELFSEGSTLQTANGKFYLNCKLLINAYVESPKLPTLFSQALVDAALPTLKMPTTNTYVIKVLSPPEVTVIATRVLN